MGGNHNTRNEYNNEHFAKPLEMGRLSPEKLDHDQLISYDKYDSKIHKNNLDRDMDEQKKKLENIYKHNDSDYNKVKRSMLEQNQSQMNQHWRHKNQVRDNIRVLGVDSKNLTEEIKDKERQENEIRRYNQMSYKQILDGQVKS